MDTLPFTIMITGPAGAGKTTFASALFDALSSVKGPPRLARLSFASSLKGAVNGAESAFNLPMTDWNDYGAKAAARPLLVALGRHLRSKDSDVFAKHLADIVCGKDGPEIVIIDDWRYINEYRVLSRRVRHVVPVRIERAGYGPANDEEAGSLAEIDEVFDELPTTFRIPEWRSDTELKLQTAIVADFMTSVVSAARKAGVAGA